MATDDDRSFIPDPEQEPPSCDYCRAVSDVQVTFFDGLTASPEAPTNVCMRCIQGNARFSSRLSKCKHVRLVSWSTGQQSTGVPERLDKLLGMLKARSGFKTITSAIRITTGRSRMSTLTCAACQDAISLTAPGLLRWSTRQDGKYHSVRLFHKECFTVPTGPSSVPGLWEELDNIHKIDRTHFSLVAAELLDQIQKQWEEMKEKQENE